LQIVPRIQIGIRIAPLSSLDGRKDDVLIL
jgi:hypothetical protein